MKHLRLWVIFGVLAVGLVGCGPTSPATLTTSTPGVVTTTTPTLPTGTLPASPIPATHILPSPTRQLRPTKTSVLPTPSPMPTLPPEVEQLLVLGLLESNAGCRLPCWWGFTPGVTLGQTAWDFFKALGRPLNDSPTSFEVSMEAEQRGTGISQSYYSKGGTIEMVVVYTTDLLFDPASAERDPHFQQDMRNYMLPQILATYGPPAQVLFSANRYMPEGEFNIVLFYPEQGILVHYSGNMDRGEEVIRLCPQQSFEISLWLWAPGRAVTPKEIAPELGIDEGIVDYRPLEEATDLTIEQFYQAFREGGSQDCIETPTSLWP